MSDDLVSRLRQDAEMLQDGPQSNLTKLWHSEVVKDAAKDCQEAATALTEARAEIERLRSTTVGDWASQRENDVLTIEKYEWKARADAAESELSTLRARAEQAESALAEAVGHLRSCVSELQADRSVGSEPMGHAERAARRFIESQEPAEQEK